MKVLDLFSGIGGFSLGLEATGGFETKLFCEINPYARRVLAHHWPEVPIHDDVTTLNCARGSFDVICGGFPCQDISLSGSGAGLDGARSGLWFQFLRLISEVRPSWAIIENVSALRGRGLEVVLRGLAAIGYDAEWHCIPASAIGAPHRRDRIWIMAYPHGEPGRAEPSQSDRAAGQAWDQLDRRGQSSDVAYPHGEPGHERRIGDAGEGEGRRDAGGSRISADALADADKPRLEVKLDWQAGELSSALGAHDWSSEPNVGRVAYGVPDRVHRLTALGNAVVPAIPYAIGRAILCA